jgi:hypothetical protein
MDPARCKPFLQRQNLERLLEMLLGREAMFTSNRSSKHWGCKYIVPWIAFCHALCFRALVCSLCWSTISLPRAKLAFFLAQRRYTALVGDALNVDPARCKPFLQRQNLERLLEMLLEGRLEKKFM